MNEEKRLFFGIEAHAPWPEHVPNGRIIDENSRHLTLAFLGKTNYTELQGALQELPKPDFHIGASGFFDECLFLPPRHPNVVSWHVNWLSGESSLHEYQKTLVHWLQERDFMKPDDRDFLPHVTLCRKPFWPREWKKAFKRIPVFTLHLHLYESLGHSKYQPIWSHPIKACFEEIEHTADIAFLIRGKNIEEIHVHALVALAFRYPILLPYLVRRQTISNLDDIIIDLNSIVTQMDSEEGSPFKAISYHGDIKLETNSDILQWEMIVDV